MARKGSKKELSVRHEQCVADLYGGKRSNSSGGAVTDEGDVRVVTDNTLFECKGKFGTLLGQVPVKATLLKQFEKVFDESAAVLKEPALALRFYSPQSVLADSEGWVDLAVRLLEDDAMRSTKLAERYRCDEEGRCHSN